MPFVAAPAVVHIPAPLAHQRPIVESRARFKIVRAGRRGGKTVVAEYCAVVGHGPEGEDGRPIHKALAQDMDVVWLARDYPQAGIVWHEFFRPRFKGVRGVKLNEADRTLTLLGAGTLFLVSAENIASIRGIGKRLGGVVVEEGAWLDLHSALVDVLLPALMDNEGWLLIISTTNAGPDGGKDDAGQPRSPSYFNTIVEEIQKGERTAEWEDFYFTAEDNPKISATAFQSLVDEYTPGSPSLEQEVYARLLKGGVGVALAKLSKAVHLVPAVPLDDMPDTWRHFGGFDWGYNHPWVFGWYVVDDDGNVAKVDTLRGREHEPEEIGRIITASVPVEKLHLVYAGHDIFGKKGKAIGYKGQTIAEQLRTFGLRLIRANVDRVQGLDNFRRFIYWEGTAEGRIVRPPKFALYDTPGNRDCLKRLQAIQIDPDRIEDALKVDANSRGEGGDDDYDETRYALMSRYRATRQAPAPVVSGDRVKLTDYEKGRMRDYPHDADTLLVGDGNRRAPRVTAPRHHSFRGKR